MKTSFRRKFTETIPAGGNKKVDKGGSMLTVRDCSAEFEVAFDQAANESIEAGVRFDTGTDPFTSFTIYNLSSTVALTVSGWVGLGTGRAGVYYDYQRVRTTKPFGTDGNVGVGVGNAVTIPGVATTAAGYATAGIPVGARRRQIVIQNLNTANDLIVTDANDSVVQRIGHTAMNVTFTLESDATFKIYGSVAAQGYTVCELFYV